MNSVFEELCKCTGTYLKGTVSRDFLLLVFFIYQFPPSPIRTVSNFFENSRRYLQVKVHQPPVVICHRYQEYDTRRTGGKILQPVSLKPVANLPLVSLTPVVHLYLRREFSKKFETTLRYTQGLGGNWFMKKNQKSKISWHCPFKKNRENYNFLLASWRSLRKRRRIRSWIRIR
jgi:hypothetical protein